MLHHKHSSLAGLLKATPIILMALIASCKENDPSNPEYFYNGMIGDKHVRFYEERYYENDLEIKYRDGRTIYYIDDEGKNDFKLDMLKICTPKKDTIIYMKDDPIGKKLVEEQQTLFDTTLSRIYEINYNKGRKLLDPNK